MKKEFEIRSATISTDEENQKLVGYAVKWNSPSQVLYCDFVESFAPKAFSESLASGEDVRALFEHDYTKLLGRTSAGTLKLEEDSIGLRFELTPPDTTLGRDSLARLYIKIPCFFFSPKAERHSANIAAFNTYQQITPYGGIRWC